jgi:hypothetical protein
VIKKLLERGGPPDDIYFFGGLTSDEATMKRVRASPTHSMRTVFRRATGGLIAAATHPTRRLNP